MSHLLRRSLVVATLVAAVYAVPGQAKPSSTLVSFRAAQANAGRHITATAKGGLVLGSTVLSNKEVFTLIDLNGGALKSGDAVQITFDSGEHPSYWHEANGKITRTGEHPNAASTFKVVWKQPNVSLMLRAASGKFVSGPGKGQPVAVVAKAGDPTTVFTLIKNPKPVKVVRKSAPKATPKNAKKA